MTTDVPERRVWVPAELQHDGAAPVDHEVEPAVVPGHGEALVGQGRRHPDPDEAHAVGGDHPAADDGGATETQERIAF